jgi:glycerophosphoryl diester phosphodiesterase
MRFSRHLRQLDGLFDRPIAHRGLHGSGAIENTVSAFASAIAGSFAIECDVQLTRDGEPIVFHDTTLERLSDVHSAVEDKSVCELKAVELFGTSDRIQTFGELLDQVSGKVPLVVEIKSSWNANARLTLRILDVAGQYKGLISFMSFDPDVVSLLAHHAPNHIRGIVADRAFDDYYRRMPVERRRYLRSFGHLGESKPHFISFDHAGLPFSPVQSLRASGMPTISWTIRSSKEAGRALRYSDQITFENYVPA